MHRLTDPRPYLLSLICAFLIACGSMPTFSQQVSAAKTLNTQVRIAATHLLAAKAIDADDGEHVLEATDAAKEGIVIVERMAKTDLSTAGAKLTAIMTGLLSVQKYLATKTPGAKP